MTYLDYNATAPIRPEVIAHVMEVMQTTGNASSVHQNGRQARRYVEQARNVIADHIGIYAAQIVFTSGGTEGNNTILSGQNWDAVLTTGCEHDAVLQSVAPLEFIPVDENGIIKLDLLKARLKALQGKKVLVSVMYVNNETGVCQPIAEIVKIVREYGAMFHSDAVQALGKIDLEYQNIQPDFLTVSAHKLGGPQGVGALIVKNKVSLASWLKGGGQEQRRRAGTENVAGIAGFGTACALAYAEMQERAALYTQWRDQAEQFLKQQGAIIFGDKVMRAPHVSNIAMPNVRSQTQLMSFDLDKISISTGSACSSGKVKSSHVLEAMSVPTDLAECAIRMSMGWQSTQQDIEAFSASWLKISQRGIQK